MATREEIITILENLSSQIIRDAVAEVTANVQEATPVDTGWARANWVPQVGSPFRGTAGTREQADEGIINEAPAQAGLSAVLSYDVSSGRAYVSNNVPYILRLNEGSSTQAPSGFIQQGIEQALLDILPRIATR